MKLTEEERLETVVALRMNIREGLKARKYAPKERQSELRRYLRIAISALRKMRLMRGTARKGARK